MQTKLVTRSAAVRTTTGVDKLDISDLENVSVYISQVVDAGTATVQISKTPDGTALVAMGAALTEASWAAGNNVALEKTLSDTNGMGTLCLQVQMNVSAIAGGGSYQLIVQGKQRQGYKS